MGAAQAILERRNDPNPPGFELRQAAGPYKLLELKPPG
jgi:hypothetical protein